MAKYVHESMLNIRCVTLPPREGAGGGALKGSMGIGVPPRPLNRDPV